MKCTTKVPLLHLNPPLAASDASCLFFFNASELKPDLRWLPHGNSRVVCVSVCVALLCASNMKQKKKKSVKQSGAVN